MTIKISKRYIYLMIAFIIIISVVVITTSCVNEKSPISPSNISSADLQALELRAAAGDPVAQYGLTLYIDDPERTKILIRKAAKSGYPPAVVTYADELILKEGNDGINACKTLEPVARNGYYPAIIMLSKYIELGKCNSQSKKDALMWTVFARLLSEQKDINKRKLYLYEVDGKLYESDKKTANEIEQRLKKELSIVEIKRAYKDAGLLMRQKNR